MNGEEIKAARLQAKMTQEQAARYIGVSVQTVHRWERGLHKPIPVMEKAIKKALKMRSENGNI